MTSAAITWHQPRVAPFAAPEFYAGDVATVGAAPGRVTITSCGSRDLSHPDREAALRSPEDFRAAFPDGRLPGDGEDGWAWRYNGWFSLFQGPHEIGDPFDDLDDALAAATHLAH